MTHKNQAVIVSIDQSTKTERQRMVDVSSEKHES